MWFRSQDLFTLVNCERVTIKQCATEEFNVIGDGLIVLGRYSKAEKALKVLDMVQQHIKHPVSKRVTHIHYANSSPTSYITDEITIFPMPKDEDVNA